MVSAHAGLCQSRSVLSALLYQLILTADTAWLTVQLFVESLVFALTLTLFVDTHSCNAADGPIEQRFHARDEDTDVTGQQPIAALLTMSQAEDQSEVHPEASSYKRVDLVGRADLLERAISRGSSLREGDFTSLLLPGTTTNVTELGRSTYSHCLSCS